MRPQACQNRVGGFISVAALCFGLSLAGVVLVAGDSWPQLRGAGGDGIAVDADPPLEWSESSNVKWKTAVPARGHSSPVIRDGRVYLATAIEKNTREERVGTNKCFAADHITIKVLAYGLDDGKLLWEQTLFEVENPDPVHTLNSFSQKVHDLLLQQHHPATLSQYQPVCVRIVFSISSLCLLLFPPPVGLLPLAVAALKSIVEPSIQRLQRSCTRGKVVQCGVCIWQRISGAIDR